MKEIWKAVKGSEGAYEVSDHGRVRSLNRIIHPRGRADYPVNGKMLKGRLNPGGYFIVGLLKNSLQKNAGIHRLVAEAFVEQATGKPCVNHMNGIKIDNRVENLEMVTCSENTKHAYSIGTMTRKGEKNTAAKMTNEDVDAIRLSKSSGIPSRAIAILFGVAHSAILRIWNGNGWSHLPA